MKITITRSGNELTASLRGDLNESCEGELKDLLGKIEVPSLVVDAERVELINSLGARYWMIFMKALSKKATAVRFKRCSPAFVESCNMYPSFVPENSIESLFFPAKCQSCGEVDPALVIRENFSKENPVADHKCGTCQSPLEPSLDVEEFMQSTRS